eukprot:TRINITY_DN40245_c0_g1_i1.p2 TRINITY_DN40245_c0_g1~~TRINITY_DN40245_c0_g1_i1.p2  ORF type:complete len:103 (+),score=6.28 TRINITY_DN40245_c0_g1_i1:87-395(+)
MYFMFDRPIKLSSQRDEFCDSTVHVHYVEGQEGRIAFVRCYITGRAHKSELKRTACELGPIQSADIKRETKSIRVKFRSSRHVSVQLNNPSDGGHCSSLLPA